MKRAQRIFEDYQSENGNSDERYNLAYKRVKKIKGFYVHALVYVLVNLFIILTRNNYNVFKSDEFWNWDVFSTAIYWGIGLGFHGFSVFGKNIFFGKDWEERKIQEFMDKEKNQKWE